MSDAMRPQGLEAVRRLLARRDIAYAMIEHPDTFSAAAEARIAAVTPDHAAKAVMTRDEDDYLLAVLPASELLDLHKLRGVASRPGLRLATEQELAADFPDFEVGALPPFGELFGCAKVLDRRIVSGGRVLCNAGDHRHSVVIDATELRFAANAGVGDIVADADRREYPGR
jgi:Ala-tRNA(Pro) deacylase